MIVAMAVYIYISPHFSGDFQTRYVSPERLTVYLGLDINGAIGTILQVAVLVVIRSRSRPGSGAHRRRRFLRRPVDVGDGHFRGGAAKIAVVGSALFGMISAARSATCWPSASSPFRPWSSPASRPTGGGYRIGGLDRRPVDAAGDGRRCLIMAEFLQVPYGAVCVAAAIPAILYYACLFFHVDLEAAKHKIGAAQIVDAPRLSEVLKSGWHFVIPIVFLVVALIYPEVFRLTPEKAAVVSTALLMVLSLIFVTAASG